SRSPSITGWSTASRARASCRRSAATSRTRTSSSSPPSSGAPQQQTRGAPMATIKKKALVIGAGTGGYPCAIRLAQLGVDTMIVEKAQPGGVSLNWGCITSKALIAATKLHHKAMHSAAMGLTFTGASVDMKQMQAWKAGVVKKLTTGVQGR